MLPKVTKYTRDGEVDPGVRAVAEAIKDTFASTNVNWATYGTTYDFVRDEVEKVAYFVASRGGGAFSEDVFREYLGAAPKEGHGVAVLRGFEGAVDKDGVVLALSPYVTHWWEEGHQNEPYARSLYERLLDGQPDQAMLVEALLFYDPSGDFAAELQAADAPLDLAREVAEKTASGVPPLGRKWIVAGLVSAGKPVLEARAIASEVYYKGGNYLGWKQEQERRDEVRAILVRFDPGVSDEQVEAVARSPVPLGAIEATFRALSTRAAAPAPEAEDTGAGAGTYLAIGALAAGGYFLWKRARR